MKLSLLGILAICLLPAFANANGADERLNAVCSYDCEYFEGCWGFVTKKSHLTYMELMTLDEIEQRKNSSEFKDFCIANPPPSQGYGVDNVFVGVSNFNCSFEK